MPTEDIKYDTQTGRRLDSGQMTSPIGAKFDVNTGQKINTMTSDELSGASKIIKTPTVPTIDTTTGLQAGVNATASNLKNELARAEAETTTNRSKISSLYSKLGLEEQMKQDEYKSSGATEAKTKYQDYISKIEEEQRAFEKTKRSIEQNREGLFGGAITRVDERRRAKELKLAESQSLERQADIAILANTEARRYTNLKEIADAKVNAKIAPLKLELEKEKLFYSENRDMMTKKEQRAYEAMITEDERKYNETKVQEQNLQKVKTEMLISANEQGATSDIKRAIQASTTVEEAINSAGQYAGNILDRQIKQAQIEKLQAETVGDEKAKNAIAMVSSVNPNSPTYIEDVMEASSGGKELTGEQTKPISKALTVIGQIDSLTNTLSKTDTGPILGILRSNNPYDVKASLVKAQLQAIIPNLARGVYGEVGVLTDTDIANYTKTLGNLRKPSDINNLLTAMTLKTIRSGIDDQLDVFGASGRDVSGFKNLYVRLNERIDSIEGKLGITKENQGLINGGNIVTAPDGTQIEIID